MDYAKRAEELFRDKAGSIPPCHLNSAMARREMVPVIAAELRAAHDAGVAEERARWQALVDVVLGSAPLHWAATSDINAAANWEKRVTDVIAMLQNPGSAAKEGGR